MLLGIALSGVAIICVITAPASFNRSSTLALSPSALAAKEPATMANPHAITDIFFIVIILALLSTFDFVRGDRQTACFQPYKMGFLHSELYQPSHPNENTSMIAARKKNVGCRDRCGNDPPLSLQPLSQVCVAWNTLTHIGLSHNGTEVGIPWSTFC